MSTRDGTSGLRPPASPRLDDAKVDKAIREHEQAFAALMNLPAASLRVIKDVVMADGPIVHVPHGLGRAPLFVAVSPVRGAASSGRIEEVRDGIDRTRYVVLQAIGFTANVTIDVMVL